MDSSNSDGRERVLVVLAHPDDPEYFCGGTVARWASEGRAVTYCLVTSGDKGADGQEVDPRDLARRREGEQQAAADVLGVAEVVFLRRQDGTLEPDMDLRRDIVRVIRQVAPDTLVTCDPTTLFPRRTRINHADHRAVGMATVDAVYPAAGSALFFPELLAEGLKPHKVRTIYLAGSQDADTAIDVTDFVERKLEALRCHASQIEDTDELAPRIRERMRDPDSPDAAPRYLEHFHRLAPFD
jgi:LmbE family N-acetylglucosaminyl deacetylase